MGRRGQIGEQRVAVDSRQRQGPFDLTRTFREQGGDEVSRQEVGQLFENRCAKNRNFLAMEAVERRQ